MVDRLDLYRVEKAAVAEQVMKASKSNNPNKLEQKDIKHIYGDLPAYEGKNDATLKAPEIKKDEKAAAPARKDAFKNS